MRLRQRNLAGRIALPILLAALLAMSGCWQWSAIGPVEQAPSVSLVPGAGQLNLYNKGDADLDLWGDKLEGFPRNIDEQARIIPSNGSFSFPTDKLKAAMLSSVGHDGEKRVPFEVYLSDLSGRSYIASFDLQVKMTSGSMTIDPQQIGLRLANDFHDSSRS
ncbi:MAG TPA: hypothetical protein VNE82_17070 [Candidatus Binataceae bacterium]|nr:hypothetical protein [Candidatus Binataceae bacterium]